MRTPSRSPDRVSIRAAEAVDSSALRFLTATALEAKRKLEEEEEEELQRRRRELIALLDVLRERRTPAQHSRYQTLTEWAQRRKKKKRMKKKRSKSSSRSSSARTAHTGKSRHYSSSPYLALLVRCLRPA